MYVLGNIGLGLDLYQTDWRWLAFESINLWVFVWTLKTMEVCEMAKLSTRLYLGKVKDLKR